MFTHKPTWLRHDWLAQLAGRSVSGNLGQTDGHLDLLASWDTKQTRLDEWLLYRIDSGSVLISCESTNICVPAGSLVLIPGGQTFRSRAAHGPCRLARCRLDLPHGPRGMLALPCLRSVAISEIINLATREEAPLQGQRIAGLLLSALAPYLEDHQQEEGQLSPEQRGLLEAWCATNIRHRPEAGDIAQVLGLSLDYCSRLFRRSYGCAPRAWLLRERLRHVAVALRESNDSLDDIARSFGYADQNLMGRQFKKAFGCSPRRYRLQDQNN